MISPVQPEQTPAVDPRPGSVVVGIDGSDSSMRALRWALAEGVRRDVTVTVVHTWNTLTAGDGLNCPTEESAEEFVRSEIESASAGLGAVPPVVTAITRGSAARTLVDLSTTASLLVLGQSRRAAAHGMLAGSVCAICVRRAHCQVVIVPVHGDPLTPPPAEHRPLSVG